MDTSLHLSCQSLRYSKYVLQPAIDQHFNEKRQVLLFGSSSFPENLLSLKRCEKLSKHLEDESTVQLKTIKDYASFPVCGLWMVVFAEESDKNWIENTVLSYRTSLKLKVYQPNEKLRYRVYIKSGPINRRKLENFLKVMKRQSFNTTKWHFNPQTVLHKPFHSSFKLLVDLESGYKIIKRVERTRYKGKYVHFAKLPEQKHVLPLPTELL